MAIDPFYRLDPFQNLVNVSWGNYIALQGYLYQKDEDLDSSIMVYFPEQTNWSAGWESRTHEAGTWEPESTSGLTIFYLKDFSIRSHIGIDVTLRKPDGTWSPGTTTQTDTVENVHALHFADWQYDGRPFISSTMGGDYFYRGCFVGGCSVRLKDKDNYLNAKGEPLLDPQGNPFKAVTTVPIEFRDWSLGSPTGWVHESSDYNDHFYYGSAGGANNDDVSHIWPSVGDPTASVADHWDIDVAGTTTYKGVTYEAVAVSAMGAEPTSVYYILYKPKSGP